MGLVITWSADVLARYDELKTLPNVSSSAVAEGLIGMAEAYVHSKLAPRYATPFSGTNLTAKDLMVDALYVQVMTTRQPDKVKVLRASLKERIDDLLSGRATMATSSGSAVAMVGDTVWSSSENYPPTFGMSDVEEASVNSQQIYDERSARGELL